MKTHNLFYFDIQYRIKFIFTIIQISINAVFIEIASVGCLFFFSGAKNPRLEGAAGVEFRQGRHGAESRSKPFEGVGRGGIAAAATGMKNSYGGDGDCQDRHHFS
ncbi:MULTISPECIES: hypothetical protein [Brucella]|uniref:hypothetical protein n=1 Tax=Brucella/Ochrobactrum group TaxID=2826938 RepID=UPI000F600628|nr:MULTISPECIES: hypothetical protein [Brucella]MCI1002172.1 hypothetical protein [Ochrobactrum sp. C6C9]MDX4076120.1 hypothetical protein [Brucella sp. NBRC 113783]RRD22723.1 hypothetical protein ECB98_19130 [Brucellaceae bacterium VT-16-1752]